MKKILSIGALLLLTGSASAQIAFSEVFEGTSGSLKYVEIHNTTNAPIDLAAGGWMLSRYANANTTSTDVALTGTIPARGFYVVANNATDFNTNTFGFDADLYNSSVISHNGDDEYELHDTNGLVDSFAGDHIGDTTDFSPNQVAFRIMGAYPNNGAWGDTTIPADGGNSTSGFWTVINITSGNGNAVAVATPGAKGGAGGNELPVTLQSFSVE